MVLLMVLCGYYRIGPLVTLGGDLLGATTYEGRQVADDFVIVYPKIVQLHELGFPSQSPFGTLSSHERVFEDPTRIQGVRDYQPGDSPRRIHWTATASTGRLLVKQYQPAIARETLICLDMNQNNYERGQRYTATELAIVIAASTSFLMPIGHQVNVLVFGPGGYRFADYTRVGVWLNLILFILTALILPLIWPLT